MNIFNLSTKKEAIPVGIKKQDSSNILQKIQGIWKKNSEKKEYVYTNNSLWLAEKEASEEIIKAHYLHHEENSGNFIYLTDNINALIVSRLPIYICNWTKEKKQSDQASEIAINLFNSLLDRHHFEKIFFSEKMVQYFKSKNDEHLAFKISHLLCEARFNRVNINTDVIYEACIRATDNEDLHNYIKDILVPYKALEKSGEINENSAFNLDLLINNKFNVAFIIDHQTQAHIELKKTMIKYCNSILNHEKEHSYRLYSINMNEDLLSECYENVASHEFVVSDKTLSQETFDKYTDIAIAINQSKNPPPQWFFEYLKNLGINLTEKNKEVDSQEALTLFDNHEMFTLEKFDMKEIKSPIMNDETYSLNEEKYLKKLVNVVEKVELENAVKK
jgi:hypothetical protein